MGLSKNRGNRLGHLSINVCKSRRLASLFPLSSQKQWYWVLVNILTKSSVRIRRQGYLCNWIVEKKRIHWPFFCHPFVAISVSFPALPQPYPESRSLIPSSSLKWHHSPTVWAAYKRHTPQHYSLYLLTASKYSLESLGLGLIVFSPFCQLAGHTLSRHRC